MVEEIVTTEQEQNDIAFTLTPAQIVAELDKYIVGQAEAKRAVAIAMRNRWRRQQLDDDLRQEVTPKNILMIGPTGVGKTEISRRLAALAGAPFLKVEATKFTEVGYVGRDVESIIRDLAANAVKMQREKATREVEEKAQLAAEERILDLLLPSKEKKSAEEGSVADDLSQVFGDAVTDKKSTSGAKEDADKNDGAARKMFRKKLRSGKLDDKEIEIDLRARTSRMEIMGPAGMEEMTNQLQSMLEGMGSNKRKKHKMKVKDALAAAIDEEAAKMVNEDDIKSQAIKNIEQNGIVFIDEIDKVARRSESGGGNGDVSREGVQRDLLPLVEGCAVNTKFGTVKTDHILFIASGAFHMAKPSDLVPELQGRLPIRVELKALTADDFKSILTEPKSSLTKQYAGLMETEGVKLSFTKDGIKQIADIAFQVNDRSENIGARRLYTILERLLEPLSYEASDKAGQKVSISGKYVKERLADCIEDEDLSRWVL